MNSLRQRRRLRRTSGSHVSLLMAEEELWATEVVSMEAQNSPSPEGPNTRGASCHNTVEVVIEVESVRLAKWKAADARDGVSGSRFWLNPLLTCSQVDFYSDGCPQCITRGDLCVPSQGLASSCTHCKERKVHCPKAKGPASHQVAMEKGKEGVRCTKRVQSNVVVTEEPRGKYWQVYGVTRSPVGDSR